MPEISFGDLVKGLRGWARHRTAHEQAAVELLVWHETWLRRPDFRNAAVTQLAPGLVAIINWEKARGFVDGGYFEPGKNKPLPASSSERRILDLAVALGEDAFGLAHFGVVHRWRAADAFAAACGQKLEGQPPAVHNHPDFVEGDPVLCAACAREMGEGRADAG